MPGSAPHRHLPRRAFALRMLRQVALAQLGVAVSLFIGMAGFHRFEHLPWLDSFVESSMILSGMGSARELMTDGGKLFGGIFALYGGLLFLGVGGFIMHPVLERIFHQKSGK